ncbi:MAG: GNAT family N-acetyltransferase [Eubacteriales bacterium]|nr:GNAT family N-acetyltransferase [Eubacteriales bacterium]
MELKFVEVDDNDLLSLVAELDVFFHAGWGETAEKYKAYHDLSGMACAVVAYIDGKPAGCGCWRAFDPVTAEIKRMYVRPAYRRQGAAGKVVQMLEDHAAASGCHRAVLETGADMPEAISFYERQGYRLVPNYGDFIGDEICVCMEKTVSDGTMR